MQETKIVKKCQKNNLKAYRWIFKKYSEPMLHIAKRLLHSQEDAEDAVQETFIKLFRGIKNFRFQSKFSTYLFTILTRVCFDTINRRKKLHVIDIKDEQHSYHTDPDLKIRLEQAIDELPMRMQTCFVLFAIEGFKQQEIAEILDISIGGVKSNIYQAKVKLQFFLNEQQNEESS
ncbi:MAG: RNA polymerase sigma factor [Desulfobacteraceae bacterium]|jgi:RNA polymerase sigma-70 factor (ECF subfamily)